MQHMENTAIALAEPQAISTEVLIEKYAKGGETSITQVRARVAEALAQVEEPKQRKKSEDEYLWAMQPGFIQAGDRKSVVQGKSVSPSVDLGGDRHIKKKKIHNSQH